MRSEAERQAAVLQALWSDHAESLDTPGWHEQGVRLAQGLSAYRGNARATAERALASAYPTVLALLGEEALAVLARQLWRNRPPRAGDLARWGADLPDWLAQQPELHDWPYLPDCARLDWARQTAELAADAHFQPDSLALLGQVDPGQLVLHLRPGLSVLDSEWPVVAIWQAHQGAEPSLDGLRTALAAARAETAAVWRTQWRAEVVTLPQTMSTWMQALAAEPQRPLSGSLAVADAGFDLGAWLALALHHGWIWRVRLLSDRAD